MKRAMVLVGLLCMWGLVAQGAESFAYRQDGPVGVIQMPDGALVPDVTVDSQGVLGTSTSGTKATAFVGADDRFYVVTTAKK